VGGFWPQPRSQGLSLEGGTHLKGKSPGNEVVLANEMWEKLHRMIMAMSIRTALSREFTTTMRKGERSEDE